MNYERLILTDLEDEGIYDVYFHRGRLHVINDWDEGAVRMVLRDYYPNFEQGDVVCDAYTEANYA